MIAILLALVLWQPNIPGRTYHKVPLEKMKDSQRTHVLTCGPVVYSRAMRDGDRHITLDNGKAKIVLEIIPLIPLQPPKKRMLIEAWGIRRYDEAHNWPEIHPLEGWREVDKCS